MLDNQQLFKFIPKHIRQWTEKDVTEWFKINDIQLDQSVKINGEQFLNLTPNKLMIELKLSSFLTRKISDWLEFETTDFDSYVDQVSPNSKTSKVNQSPFQQLQLKRQATNSQKQEFQLKSDENSRNQLFEFQNNSGHQSDQKQGKNSQTKQNKEIQLNENQSSQMYKPSKYIVRKHPQNMSNFPQHVIRHSESARQISLFNPKADFKKMLVLKELVQNSAENNDDTETCKHLPEESDYFEAFQPLKKISSENYLLNSGNPPPDKSYYSNQVRFVSSQLLLANNSLLSAFYNNSFCQITKTTRVGRSPSNDIVLVSEGVSRHHAQIIVEQEMDVEGRMQKKYYLKDVGSKFGTFVETDPEKPKKIAQNQQYCIGQTTIRIDKLKLHKSRQKFDLTISVITNQEQQRSYANKFSITIGNRRRQSQLKEVKSSQITKRCVPSRQKRDLELQDNDVKNYHCRFVIINGEVQLEQVEGNILEKIQKNVHFPFSRNQYEVKFGDGNVLFKLQQLYKPLPDNLH